jgi:type I restriction enzyme, S subunit
LNLDEVKRFELVEGELEKWMLEPGDLMVVEGNGSEDEIGRCAIWQGEIDNCVHQNHLIKCRPVNKELSNYVLMLLNSPIGINEMKRLAVTTSGLYNLSVSKIRGINIPLPPLAEQRRIIVKVDQLMDLCNYLDQQIDAATSKRTGLLNALIAQV